MLSDIIHSVSVLRFVHICFPLVRSTSLVVRCVPGDVWCRWRLAVAPVLATLLGPLLPPGPPEPLTPPYDTHHPPSPLSLPLQSSSRAQDVLSPCRPCHYPTAPATTPPPPITIKLSHGLPLCVPLPFPVVNVSKVPA